MPGKRKRIQPNDSDDYASSSCSEFEDKPSRINPRKRHSTKQKQMHQTSNLHMSTSNHSKSTHTLSEIPHIQDELLNWFATVRDARGMPWRKPYDPHLDAGERAQRAYEVWVSEIMLQQTQVATVIPYYNAWMEKFPTIECLAASSIEDVNAIWKGLGYYSRASRLLVGAQKVVKEYGSKLPDNAKDMEANIPGIGRYTAGAICSIAYGERAPILDGNVHRLLSRMLALHAPPKSKATLDILWSAANAMVTVSDPDEDEECGNAGVSKHPGDINQALIELGSTVCKVRDPSCDLCPLRPWCHGQTRQVQEIEDIEDICTLCEPLADFSDVTVYPMKAEKKRAREETDVVTVVEWLPQPTDTANQSQFLLVRRPEKGLLAGLYEFPTTPNVSPSLSPQHITNIGIDQMASAVRDSITQLSDPCPIGVSQREKSTYTVVDVTFAGDVQHVFSHIRKTYKVQRIRITGGEAPPKLEYACGTREAKHSEAVWIPMGRVTEANISTGVAKVWRLVKSLRA
ncbi:DNA glycosylase [Marasmius fiardii PR-910]|nr:DNA glycosylase [Marasmius fiardii PR-910]